MSYGGEGPVQQLYDSCGSPESGGPHALCGFIFDAGADLPSDDTLKPQVIAFCVLGLRICRGKFAWPGVLLLQMDTRT